MQEQVERFNLLTFVDLKKKKTTLTFQWVFKNHQKCQTWSTSHIRSVLKIFSPHCMAMLTCPCMEESRVCTTYSVEVNCRVIKRKRGNKRKQAPTVNSSIYLHRFKWMNGYLHVAKGVLRLFESYEGEMEWSQEGGNNPTPSGDICPRMKEKKKTNCAIFICPYRETAVATIPAIDLNPREWNRFPFLKSL